MNKAKIDKLLPKAVDIIRNSDISSKNGKDVPKAFRSQISSFGAAISMGSILAATAFFQQQGNSDVNRRLLMDAINQLLTNEKIYPSAEEYATLFDRVRAEISAGHERRIREEILNCAVALKLAMNLFHLTEENSEKQQDEKREEEG